MTTPTGCEPSLPGDSELTGREPGLVLWEAWALRGFDASFGAYPTFVNIGVFSRDQAGAALLEYATIHHSHKAPFEWNGSQLLTPHSGWAYGFLHQYGAPKR